MTFLLKVSLHSNDLALRKTFTNFDINSEKYENDADTCIFMKCDRNLITGSEEDEKNLL